MLRIAICDDEQDLVDKIKNIIKEYEDIEDIRFSIDTYSSGVSLIRNFDGYDLIFLDIDMPGMDGIEVARKLRADDVIAKIIYVTNHASFTNQALSIHAFGYIVKPFECSEVFLLLDDFVKYIKLETVEECKKLSFKTANGLICLNTDDILYFEYHRNVGVEIVTCNESIYTRSTLQEVWETVAKYGFALPHKSFIVNLLYIKNIDGLDITMENNMTVPIAQKRASIFRTEHNRFLRRN